MTLENRIKRCIRRSMRRGKTQKEAIAICKASTEHSFKSLRRTNEPRQASQTKQG